MKGIGCRGDKLNETKSVKMDCPRGQANHRLVRLTADSQRVGQAGKIVVVENSDFISFQLFYLTLAPICGVNIISILETAFLK